MPRRGEYRIRTQVDYDHYEAFDRRHYGLPVINWLYLHRPGHWAEKGAVDVRAPYADPVDGTMRKMTPDRSGEAARQREARQRREEADERRRAAERESWSFIVEQDIANKKFDYATLCWWIESRELPEKLMVNQQEYLWQIRRLREEWAIVTDEDFERLKPKLIRHALYRMGKLPGGRFED